MLPSVAPFNDKARAAMGEALLPVLAALVDLAQGARVAHWSVRGPHFSELHTLFGGLYDAASAQADAVAEHMAMLGATPDMTTEATAEGSPLKPFPRGETDGMKFCALLRDRCADTVAAAQEAASVPDGAEDLATVDVLVDVQRAIAKFGWMLGAHVDS
jgi:starvation-inducible DNA-binding protein